MTNTIGEFAKAKLLFCIGTNMTEAHPVAATYLKNGVKTGTKLIVVDPRRQELADYANIFAQLRVGSDIAFLNGVMHVLIKENLYDKKFVEEKCENFEEFAAKIEEYPPSRASQISGVPEQTIVDIARMLGSIKPAMVIYTLGITACVRQAVVMTLANLRCSSGTWGGRRRVNPMRGQNNVQAPATWSPSQHVLRLQKVDSPESAKIRRFLGRGQHSGSGAEDRQMINGLPTGRLKAFWITARTWWPRA